MQSNMKSVKIQLKITHYWFRGRFRWFCTAFQNGCHNVLGLDFLGAGGFALIRWIVSIPLHVVPPYAKALGDRSGHELTWLGRTASDMKSFLSTAMHSPWLATESWVQGLPLGYIPVIHRFHALHAFGLTLRQVSVVTCFKRKMPIKI